MRAKTQKNAVDSRSQGFCGIMPNLVIASSLAFCAVRLTVNMGEPARILFCSVIMCRSCYFSSCESMCSALVIAIEIKLCQKITTRIPVVALQPSGTAQKAAQTAHFYLKRPLSVYCLPLFTISTFVSYWPNRHGQNTLILQDSDNRKFAA
jgi:hypothetical protein